MKDSSLLRLPKFDLRQVRAFLYLAEELHFGRASERLFTSQPALSRTLHQLEEAVGVELLERSTRRVRLTEAGAAFAAEARVAFVHLERAGGAARDVAHGLVGRLRIGYMDFAINGELPALLNGYRARYPGDMLDLEYDPSARQRSSLLEGRIDVALQIGEFTSPGVSNLLLEEYDYVVLVPSRHRLARKPQVLLSDLAQEPFVLGSEDAYSTFHRLFLPLCQQAGFFPRVVQQVSSANGIFGLVAAGVGVSVYAGCARNIQRAGVTVRPLEDVDVTIPTYAAWVDTNPSQALARFLGHLGEHLRRPPSERVAKGR